MVHALREARRVLKPDGILIDLRPPVMHSPVGILRAGRFTELGRTCGSLDGDRAANRAVSRVLAGRLFRRVMRVRLECDAVFASPEALRGWLAEFSGQEGVPSQGRLVQRVEEANRRGRGKGTIVVRIPLVMSVLRKGCYPHKGRALRGRGSQRPPAAH